MLHDLLRFFLFAFVMDFLNFTFKYIMNTYLYNAIMWYSLLPCACSNAEVPCALVTESMKEAVPAQKISQDILRSAVDHNL